MNNNPIEGDRGAHIKPSARKSIHHHREFCPFVLSEVMGRHGLPKKQDRSQQLIGISRQTANSDLGRDEVDNILSKFSKPADEFLVSHGNKRFQRRNSLDLSTEEHTDSTDDDLLAKSLPGYLPSYSPCSSDIGDWSQENNVNAHSRSSLETSQQSEIYDTPESYRFKNRFATPPSPNVILPCEEKKNSSKSVLCIAVVIIGVLGGYCGGLLDSLSGGNVLAQYDASKFYNDINNLGGKYRISQDSLLQVQIGIKTISEREDTGSFIFVYNSNEQNFNYHLFQDLLEDVSETAAKYLRNDSTSVRHLVVDSSDLNMGTTSELINRYQEDITKTGVMLIKDMDRIPSKLAMAFHYYCDEYNPLVKKSAIFFTLDLSRCSSKSGSKPIHAVIENCLATKWSSVPSENIKPLLTRVVSIVVDLTRA